jgi:hypothetical protein
MCLLLMVVEPRLVKHEVPNNNIQIPNKFQITISKYQTKDDSGLKVKLPDRINVRICKDFFVSR